MSNYFAQNLSKICMYNAIKNIPYFKRSRSIYDYKLLKHCSRGPIMIVHIFLGIVYD